MASVQDSGPSGEARLGLWDAVSVIVGIVVGAGIYETPPLVLKNVPGPWTALGVWAVVGALSLAGALCYAELATAYPRSGGDYVYLTRAYAPWVGFLFGWAQLAVIVPASIGMMAYVFADYAAHFGGLGPAGTFGCAALAVVLLTFLNALSVPLGKRAQNVLSAAKVLGLGGLLLAGFLRHPALVTPAAPPPGGSLAFALVLVFLTYGGWNDAAYVAAEVRDGRRNIPRALVLGTLAVTALYLLVNAAYLWALGFDGARRSQAVAADVLERPLGTGGAGAISLLVMASALGAVNGLVFTGSRLSSTLGSDYTLFAWMGRWHPRLRSPVAALLTQAGISLGLMALAGTAPGRSAVDALVAWVGLAGMEWEGHGGFETLLRCTAPVFWLFFLLTALSLFVLRFREPGVPRPFRVPLYPLVPLIFCGTCAYMLYGAVGYAGPLGLVGAALLLAGMPLFLLSGRRAAARRLRPREPPTGD
jgi:APA family basic amino acid/polyamine antiporter